MNDLTIGHRTLHQFRQRAQLPPCRGRDLASLTQVTRVVMALIPYTNVHMLTRTAHPPTADEIAEQMLSLEGGPCSIFNIFMNCYLRDYMGFDSTLIAADIDGVLNHTAICVNLSGENWLVDYGNGHPYLSPIQINAQEEYDHAALRYRVVPCKERKGIYLMLHRAEGDKARIDYTFSLTPREHSYFDEMFHKHYTDPAFGHFLTSLRVVRFPAGEMVAVRDQALIHTQNGKRHKQALASEQEVVAAIRQFFPSISHLINPSLNYLKEVQPCPLT